jgi:hypothetical protein
VFQLDASGQPVLVGGQPVVIQLRNCSTLTSANGDELVHTTIGDVMPAAPAQVAFSGSMTFVDGTGRFTAVSGSATFSGTASLANEYGGVLVRRDRRVLSSALRMATNFPRWRRVIFIHNVIEATSPQSVSRLPPWGSLLRKELSLGRYPGS